MTAALPVTGLGVPRYNNIYDICRDMASDYCTFTIRLQQENKKVGLGPFLLLKFYRSTDSGSSEFEGDHVEFEMLPVD